MVAIAKDPKRVEAGKIGAIRRWGAEPRVVRLDELSPPERRLILALIGAAKAERVRSNPEAA